MRRLLQDLPEELALACVRQLHDARDRASLCLALPPLGLAAKLGQRVAAGDLPSPYFINSDAAFSLSRLRSCSNLCGCGVCVRGSDVAGGACASRGVETGARRGA